MLESIEFTAVFGDEHKKVRLSEPNGGGGGYHIYINNYYHGTIKKVNYEWVGHLNRASELTSADISILADIIENSV
ncbi:hypothetical protein GFS24_10180 [Chitinophaga sp. SYP-B3965]|uniref:hypothetical protein n=1 Tax=Chitinophaga sp. SYP-B3965 TaxID=2663120 RepID=UPI001299F05C|nr:hypothetical protein [Chitinophaga sp. SYP-B3965]MRG45484.1 hypothetical protein [Chitinophaga sp. SYP-B3965]